MVSHFSKTAASRCSDSILPDNPGLPGRQVQMASALTAQRRYRASWRRITASNRPRNSWNRPRFTRNPLSAPLTMSLRSAADRARRHCKAQSRWSAQDIYVFVAAFGAMGHHLPGMIRAYGDRALFERFRWRFIFAPIFLLGVCVAFYWWDLKGIVLVVFFWGVWHGMMQTYGFCRIYDAKTGSFAALTRRLDFALCAIWFATAVVLSSQRMTDTLSVFYASGGPFVEPWTLQIAQRGLLFLAIAVAILFLANFAWGWRHAKRANPVKLALLITSISFWWYCNNGVSNLLVGIALFEVFHDVQYLSLVWIYNCNRVDKDNSIA